MKMLSSVPDVEGSSRGETVTNLRGSEKIESKISEPGKGRSVHLNPFTWTQRRDFHFQENHQCTEYTHFS